MPSPRVPFDLRSLTHLLVVAGSRAHGTASAGSDVDVRGVAVPPRRYFDGFLHSFDQADDDADIAPFVADLNAEERAACAGSKLEGSVYDVRKFCRLAAEGNPNFLEVLYCRDDEVRRVDPVGRALRDARSLFLTRRVRHSFGSYARSQLKRIKGHREWLLHPPDGEPRRADFGLPPMPERSNAELGPAERDAERRYRAAHRTWTQYSTWKRSRNPARAALEAAHGYDTKHAAHLVRLLRMGREALESGELHVWRGGRDADELIAIRGGAWSYDALVAWADEQEAALAALDRVGSPLPEAADLEAIDALVCDLVARSRAA